MKEFEEMLLMLIKVSISAIPADRAHVVDELATELYNSMSSIINEGEYNAIEVWASVYSALYEVHSAITDSLEEGDDTL